MFPMIATVAEFEVAKALAEREVAYLKRHDHRLPSDLKLGAMVEVPSLLWQLDEICARADFLSVGTNDLVQYMFAADRDNKRVASRFDPLSPPVLRALKMVVEKAHKSGTPLTLCGEMGGKPIEALGLLAIGFRSLSMSPASIGPVKAMILATDLEATSKFVNGLVEARDGAHSLRAELIRFAGAHRIPL
jgi:phosphotransferase system, enzyme I, PtsP